LTQKGGSTWISMGGFFETLAVAEKCWEE